MGTPKPKRNDKKLLWKIHHWAGLYAGILIGILSLTGALAVFIPEIDALILKHRYKAESSTSTAAYPQISNSIDSLTKWYPTYSSLAIRLPQETGDIAEVDLIVRPEGGDLQRYDFFIDAGADRIIGERNHQNSLANYLRQIHVRLYEGNWGRQLVGIGGVALVVLAITGLLIYGNFMKRQAWPDVRKKGLRIAMADWHKLLGISALAFNLVIAVTGAWLGLQPWLMRAFDIKTPNAYSAPVIMESADDKALEIDWKQVFASIKKEFPELNPSNIGVSANGSATINVRGNIAGLVYERSINTLVLSKTDYKPQYSYDVREQPFSHKFYFVQEALHFGDFGGLMLKVIYAILGLVSGFLSISGFVVYLYRRKKKHVQINPMKLTFVYSMLSILFLVLIAVISLYIGYSQAATLAAIIINGILIGLPTYAIVRYTTIKIRKRAVQTA